MKNLIKNLTIVTSLVFGMSTVSFAQVKKSDIEKLLVMQGTTFDAIEKVIINNVRTHYDDGTTALQSIDRPDCKISTTESGIFIAVGNSVANGNYAHFFPYSSIKHISVFRNRLKISLVE